MLKLRLFQSLIKRSFQASAGAFYPHDSCKEPHDMPYLMFLSLSLRRQAYTLFLSVGWLGGSGMGGGYGVLNASFPKRIAEGPRGCVGSPSIRLGFQMFPGNGLSTCIILLFLLLTAWRREIQSTQRSALAHAQHNTDGHNKPWAGNWSLLWNFGGKSLFFFFYHNCYIWPP